MTTQEHALIIGMFIRQAILLKTFADILKSHDLLSEEDAKLFESYLVQSELADPAVSRGTAQIYSALAKKLGLDVPIEYRAT
jgi:hypothetical protein